MATIEPRLIHLLNESTTPQLSNNDLPPLHSLHSLRLPASPGRSLPPLDPEGSHRGAADRQHGRHAPPPGGPASGGCGAVPVQHPGNEATTFAAPRKDEERSIATSRYVGTTPHVNATAKAIASSYPLRLLLSDGDVTTVEVPQSLVDILDDGQDSPDDACSKKRGRAINIKDDFVQLPQPVKKQKAAPQAPVMPPIINGLLEPPPHAALFPPISSSSLGGIDASQMKLLHDFNHSAAEDRTYPRPPSESDQSGGKPRKRATKPRRKWSDEETNHLLLGVNRHGVGKWTNILEDTDFRFNGRTAGDLKDRFRTCCPEELRNSKFRNGRCESGPEPGPGPGSGSGSRQKAKKGIYSENILIDEDEPSSQEPTASPNHESDSAAPKKKSRAHRKKLEDLAELGIHGPFKKSHRRERRPFTEQDDREILEGLEDYGPAWTKIQRDPRFHLSSRQPTDLRDRVRNKYPSIYQRIEKGTFQVKEARSNATLEPSVSMAIDDSFKATKAAAPAHPMSQHAVHHSASREDLPRWPFQIMEATESQPHQQLLQSFELLESSAPPTMGGEMDISRLLLDDSR